jgi:hypothetical protein
VREGLRSDKVQALGEDRPANGPVRPLPLLDDNLDFDIEDHHDQQQEKKMVLHPFLQV